MEAEKLENIKLHYPAEFLNNKVEVEVYDEKGNTLFKQLAYINESQTINGPGYNNLPVGFYLVKISGQSGTKFMSFKKIEN